MAEGKTSLTPRQSLNAFLEPGPIRTFELVEARMSRGKKCLPLCRLSPNSVTYHHEVASVPLVEVSRESCSVSS